jgi:AbrB family transcriptional regulator (stage V sporulation protein T)
LFCLKATGIVRRIDDLGRVVIPKEIRRTLRIREGDPLEIFTDNEGQVILKKYSPVGELSSFVKEYADALAQATGHITCISDKDQVIAVSGGSKKEFLDKNISSNLEKIIENRAIFKATKDDSKFAPILSEGSTEGYYSEVISPIICEGDAIGAVIFLSPNKNNLMGEVEEKLAQSAAGFIGKQMEQ